MDQQTAATSGGCGLASYISDTYRKWRDNRAELQRKWNANSLAFRCISDGAWKAGEGEGWRSESFIGITRQKVVSACALVLDMLLAGGKIPFALKPSPWEEVRGASEQDQDAVKRGIEDMRRLIEQQLLDCAADRVFMRAVLSGAVYGEMYVKRMVHEVERSRWESSLRLGDGATDASRVPGQFATFGRVVEKHLSPGVTFVPVWDLFRDLETDDLQAGAGVIHRQLVSPHWLRNKLGRSLYLDDAIKTVLATSARSGGAAAVQPESDPESLAPSLRSVQHRQNTILYLEFWGRVPREAAESYEQSRFGGAAVPTVALDDNSGQGDDVEIMTGVAGDQVVRYTRSAPQERPFVRAVWEDSLDGQGATGVADNAAASQRILNGALRAYEDNKKLSANVVLAGKRRMIDGDFREMKMGLFLDLAEECDDVNKALAPIVIPDVGESLLNLITLAEKYCDMDTLIPKLTQGLDVKEPQMRAYVAQQQLSQAGKYIGGVIRNIDEGLIEPVVESFYEYDMNDPSVERGKGDYIVRALGFTSFQDRVERIEKLKQMLTLVLSSEELKAESKLRWYLEAIAKSMDVDPDQAMRSEEEKGAEAAALPQGPPPDPLADAQAAKLQAEAQRAQADAQAKLAGVQHDADKLVIERAKAVHEMETSGAGQPATATE